MRETGSPGVLDSRCRALRSASQIRRPAGCCRRARSVSSRSAVRTSSRATGGCPRRPRRSSATTASSFQGDLGRIDERGYIYIVGRAKDLIISGGFNVYPAEVEAAIEALPGVAECAVIGVPHADFGEGVVAVVTPKPGVDLEEKAIQAALANELAKFKQPKRVFITTELPHNTMGKVQKRDLRDRYARTFVG
jgi:malonyl-CoA/methylmalonyl-CoA synthetase